MFGPAASSSSIYWPRTWLATWACIFLGDACISQFPPSLRLTYWRLLYWGFIALGLVMCQQWPHFCHRFRLQLSYFKHWSQSPIQHCGLLLTMLGLIALSGLLFKTQQTQIQKTGLESLLLISLFPFTEDLFFRGWLQTILRSRVTQNWSLFITASLFTLSHTAYWGQISSLLPIFLLGLATGYLRQRYFSLWPGVLLHISYNLLGFLLLSMP